MRHLFGCCACLAVGAVCLAATSVQAACCYFSAKNADVLQPGQKAFITWDPETKTETFTVQPRFEGNALDFGMVIPTPAQPKLDAMPRDFFKHLAVFTILKEYHVYPKSHLFPKLNLTVGKKYKKGGAPGAGEKEEEFAPRRPPVVVVETGIVGSLDYKIIKAARADELFRWLKDHKYQYAGDEATLDFYVKRGHFFTVMKIDTMQMKKTRDGSYSGDVTPTRFKFTTDKLVYPLKITQISVKDKTEALFYVQAPYKVDLPGEMSYQYQWVPLLQGSKKYLGKRDVGGARTWLNALGDELPALVRRADLLDFHFVRGKRPEANKHGRFFTTMEWARRLTERDVDILTGKVPYSDTMPNVDEGFTEQDAKDPQKRQEVLRTIRTRMLQAVKDKKGPYWVRQVPAEDAKALQQLAGYLQAGLFITKFRKIFTRGEMNDDLVIGLARLGDRRDDSEYEEILPASPP